MLKLVIMNKRFFFALISVSALLGASCNKKPTAIITALCSDDPNRQGTPVITSLSKEVVRVGEKLEVRGCNLAGLEGDLNVIIENYESQQAILHGEKDSTSQNILITLISPLCQNDTSYSGAPCEDWLKLTPGTYKIFAYPWGKESNKMKLEIK